MSLSSLRKSWLVLAGPNVPDGELANAQAVADFLRGQLNVARVLQADPYGEDPMVEALMRFCNVVVVGGPLTNPYAFYLNEYLNPRMDITVVAEKTPEQTWEEYVASGGFTQNGWICDDQVLALEGGILGYGAQPYPRARPLQIWLAAGVHYEDTCTMGKAFREDAGAGVYSCTWSDVTHEDPCPEDAEYTLVKAPAEQQEAMGLLSILRR